MSDPTTPSGFLLWFGLFPVRSPLLWESLLDFFSSSYWDVSLRMVSLLWLIYSPTDNATLLALGSPIRIPTDQSFFQLPVAFRRFRVLLRLLIPRHPPAALNSLIYKIYYYVRLKMSFIMWSFSQTPICSSKQICLFTLNFAFNTLLILSIFFL